EVRAVAAVEQVDAVEARVTGELVNLAQDLAELGGQARADRRIRGLLRLRDKRLCGLHQLGDRGDAVVGGLNGVERARHRVEQAAQVTGAVRQTLRGEVVD